MVVGDEFQSIYGFRHADLDVFRERRRLIEERADAEAMELSGNFRSRPEVIGAVNALGGELLGDSFRPLRVGAEPRQPAPPATAPRSSCCSPPATAGTPRASTWRRRSTAAPRSTASPRRAPSPRGCGSWPTRGVDRGEMVVLLRAFTHLDAYEDSLERAGLRPTWSAAAATGPSSRSPTSARCWRRSPTRSTTRRCSAPSPRPPAGSRPTRSGCCAPRRASGATSGRPSSGRSGSGEAELAEPERLAQIPEPELALLRRFAGTIEGLRERGTRLSLAGLIEAAVTETGYDLAVLMRPAGEARFANVRKLMRLAAEFEAREGRDLRGLLDFLAARAETDAEAQAATAAEGHDGVRIMTVHNAKGLEFGVVAVPDLSRSLLAGSRPPLLTIGRDGEEPRVGMQLRRLGAGAVNLYSYARALRGGEGARRRGGAAALLRRRDPGARAADPQRRRQARRPAARRSRGRR